jgi:hypothetical protein
MPAYLEAFHAGYETYLKEALADSARWKEVMGHAGVWTVSIDTALIDKYLAVKSSIAPSSTPETPPA